MTAYGKCMTIAFTISATAHLSGLGTWYALESGWAHRLNVLAQRVLRPEKVSLLPLRELKKEPPKPESVSRLVFIQTDALDEKLEPWKQTQYYSSRSTRAANPKPDAAKLGDLPKLEGKEKRIMSTADVTLPPPPPISAKAKTQPAEGNSPSPTPATAPPPPEPKDDTFPAPKPSKPSSEFALLQKDDLLLRPAKVEQPETKNQDSHNPQGKSEVTIQATTPTLARISPRKIPTRLSEQRETSVARKGKVALDVKEGLFGAYDERLQAEVARRWYALVEKYEYGERTGIVEISFKLHRDGRIEDLTIQQNTAGEVLAQYCKKAIDDSAPFEPFPEELKVLLAKEYREITFFFYY